VTEFYKPGGVTWTGRAVSEWWTTGWCDGIPSYWRPAGSRRSGTRGRFGCRRLVPGACRRVHRGPARQLRVRGRQTRHRIGAHTRERGRRPRDRQKKLQICKRPGSTASGGTDLTRGRFYDFMARAKADGAGTTTADLRAGDTEDPGRPAGHIDLDTRPARAPSLPEGLPDRPTYSRNSATRWPKGCPAAPARGEQLYRTA